MTLEFHLQYIVKPLAYLIGIFSDWKFQIRQKNSVMVVDMAICMNTYVCI